MALSERQLLLLDCFMYSDIAPQNTGYTLEFIIEDDYMVDGKVSLEKIQQKIDSNALHLSGDLSGHPEYLQHVMQEIYDDNQLANLTISNTTEERYGGIRAACYYDRSTGDATVAFRGTGGSYRQWYNNLEGFGEETQPTQEDAAAFIDSLPFDSVEVTGHSNGGDAAMYASIVCGDKISRCVSFEGQGMSKEFTGAHRDEIQKNSDKITNISAQKDFVSPLLNSVAGHCFFVKSDSKLLGGLLSHGSYGLLSAADKNGSFDSDGNFKRDSHVEQAFYCKGLHLLSKALDALSDVPIIGPGLEFTADVCGILIGLAIDENLGLLKIWDPEVREKWGMAFQDLLRSVHELYTSKLFPFMTDDFMENTVQAITYLGEQVAEWFDRNYNAGRKYASSNPYIRVDTARLRSYAGRIQKVQRRVNSVDRRLDALYTQVGLLGLSTLLKADLLTGYSWRLSRCVSYLNDTAAEFDRVEHDLIGAL